MPEKVKLFWDTIMLYGAEKSDDLIFDELFITEGKSCVRTNNEIYNSQLEFEKMKQILLDGNYKLNYKFADIKYFPEELQGQYDLILLSNIVDYCRLADFNETVRELYHNHLNKGGSIQLTTTTLQDYAVRKLCEEEGGKIKELWCVGCFGNSGIFMQKPCLEETRQVNSTKREF